MNMYNEEIIQNILNIFKEHPILIDDKKIQEKSYKCIRNFIILYNEIFKLFQDISDFRIKNNELQNEKVKLLNIRKKGKENNY